MRILLLALNLLAAVEDVRHVVGSLDRAVHVQEGGKMRAGLGARIYLVVVIALVALVAARDVTAEIENIDTLWSGAPAPGFISVATISVDTLMNFWYLDNHGPYVEPKMHAAWFNGSAYVEVPTSAVGTGDQLTVEVWVNLFWQPGADNTRDIVSSVCYGGGLWGIHTVANYNSTYGLAYNVGWITGNSTLWVPPDSPYLRVRTTHHQVVLMLDRASGKAVVYIDGKLRTSATFPVGAKPATSGFRIGKDCAASGLVAYVRHVRIYNRMLSDDEVWQNYLSPDRPVTAGLAVWLASLDDSDFTGTTWMDRAGGSQGGTAVGVNYTRHALFPPFTLEALVYTTPHPSWYPVAIGRRDYVTSSYTFNVHPCGVALTVFEGFRHFDSWGAENKFYPRCGWIHVVVAARPDGHVIKFNGETAVSTRDIVTPIYLQPILQWFVSFYVGCSNSQPFGVAWIRLFSGVPASDSEFAELSRGRAPPGLRLLYAANFTVSPPQLYAYAGSWDTSKMRMTLLTRVSGAYVDAAALSGAYARLNIFLSSRYSLGVSGRWTQSDNWRGWISVFNATNLWLNITQVGGHGVAASGLRAVGHAGLYALAYDGSTVRLYANKSLVAERAAQLPASQYPLATTLLTSFNSNLRVLLRYAWVNPGVEISCCGPVRCGTCDCWPKDEADVPYPTEASYFIDSHWSPILSSWGLLPPLPAVAREGGQPGQLEPVVLTGAVKATNAVWGPFGEVCPGRLPDGSLVSFGVRYAWRSPSAQPSCSVPLQTAPPAGTTSTVLFNATAPVQLYFASPPTQHPYAANSVPGARFCSLDAAHFLTPLLPVKAPSSTVVTDQWACAPSDYFAGGHVGQSAPGWALIVSVMRVFRVNTTSVVYLGSGSAVLARGGAVPALSVRAVDGRTWSIYTSGAGAVASAGPLQTPPNVSRTGGAVSGVFGAPRSPTTLVSQWWADGVRYYISAAGLADAPVAYISSFTGSPVAVAAELNAPGGYSYYVGVLDNGTYVWAVPLTGPMQFSVYVPAPGYYEVRLYRDADKVWGKNAYLSPDTKLIIGPVDIPVFTPVNPVSLVTPVAPKPPVFVPAVSMQMPPHAVGVLMLGIFAAAYVTMREVSLAALITGAVVAALGVLINAPIYGVAGVFLLAFGLWNKSRRQGSS